MSKVDLSELGFSQLPHYSTHAIELFEEFARVLPKKMGVPADYELLLASLLKDSVKFLLPDNGYLFADHDFKPGMFELLRLPFHICALEFTATPELYAVGSGLTHAAKRIALCFDPWQLSEPQVSLLSSLCGRPFLNGLPERCLAVMAVYEANGVWGGAVGVVVIDLEHDRPLVRKNLESTPINELASKVGERLNSLGSKHGLPATFITFPMRSALVGQTPDQATEALYVDTIDEVRCVYEFLAAVNCANVGTQDVPAPKSLNAKREKKGRPLFYPYKLLDLAPAAAGGGIAGGSHASPRTHLRRGHLRHLGERYGNKVLWINATVVNAQAGQEPVQVYKVKPAPLG